MIREGSMLLTAGGGIVSNMPTQSQAEVAPTPMRSVPFAEGVEVNGAVLDFGSEAPEPWDYLPVRSFSTLLAHLATRCRNRCRAKAVPDAPAFDCDTEPSPVQTRALELVRTFPVDFTL